MLFYFAFKWFSAGAVKPILMLRNDFVGGESKRGKTTLILKSSPDFVVSCSRFLLQQPKGIKDSFILKSSQISFFLLQESKRDKKLHLFWKVSGFCCFFCRSQRARLDYSEKFLGFVLSARESKKTTLFWKVLDFFYRSSKG